MENTSPARVPRFIWVVIIALLASMYSYAVYFDPTNPEKTVKNYFQAYLTKDYDAVASNLSVFLAARTLPQYAEMTSVELVNNREKIEKDLSKVISSMEKNNPVPENITIEVMPEYTKKGNNAAIVLYQIKVAGKDSGMQAAILIMEKGRFRIMDMTAIDPQALEQIKAENIDELDANFAEILTAEE